MAVSARLFCGWLGWLVIAQAWSGALAGRMRDDEAATPACSRCATRASARRAPTTAACRRARCGLAAPPPRRRRPCWVIPSQPIGVVKAVRAAPRQRCRGGWGRRGGATRGDGRAPRRPRAGGTQTEAPPPIAPAEGPRGARLARRACGCRRGVGVQTGRCMRFSFVAAHISTCSVNRPCSWTLTCAHVVHGMQTRSKRQA